MKVTVRAEDRNGEVKTYSGEGLVARAFCHENDHLDGKLYIDIATSMLTQEEVDALD
ncbi:Peptide deformylase [bioreactor metagenome]|uniref:Peptide deformylase n=1 Tax=bioreactor metagenome TaxID=1076179 RepID=A0A645G6B0_9ZZZZ